MAIMPGFERKKVAEQLPANYVNVAVGEKHTAGNIIITGISDVSDSAVSSIDFTEKKKTGKSDIAFTEIKTIEINGIETNMKITLKQK